MNINDATVFLCSLLLSITNYSTEASPPHPNYTILSQFICNYKLSGGLESRFSMLVQSQHGRHLRMNSSELTEC